MNDFVREKVEVVSFGCRLNLVESEAMRRAAEGAGHSDTVVFNTCAVTAESVRQARQAIRRFSRERPGAKIVVSGCAAETERARFADMPEVSAIVGNAAKTDAATWRALSCGETPVADIAQARVARPVEAARIEGHTRAFLAIQNGCDHRCTFCIIPYGRGPSRSIPAETAIAQARRLVELGHKEIVLTGVDLTSWGADLPDTPKLGFLVRALLKALPDLKRLRLSSLDCIEADEELMIALAEEERLMPHLHLSLQSGDDMILKRMKRRHARRDAIEFCARVRRLRPDIVFGADLIAGFPTETDAMAENTLRLVEDCGLTHLHVFPYSPREMTPAARMPQVTKDVRSERAKVLREAGERALERHLDAQIGKPVQVLVERGEVGRAADFTPVATPGVAAGAMVEGVIAGRDGMKLRLG
ncbi:MAG: tRNA (N(6)-L-threonylcarbamoyladenosine(37)-C(2))-methylthiotransferase MtaB [Rhodoblastus sp.]|nr:tRNA (N(6)-L-threonylcarbamoyladenosine(37)-C(2))-methylthiotransferase MtaB [Rhodoblastus sp.]